ncbi:MULTISPECIES: Dps family protein [Rossellomorea]|jgi:starvation-inducible DNA-binding protein|uniref:Dps family protein n=1 Tax=Rossellomorea TaxID=2837508 RepID=UPI0011E8B38D|nr:MULTISPECIES: DNA starvation/stationary phase protection protein [Rossellomorea]MDT9027244.1 DNA starvation/stationary phase protection protein [Rossellomorea sp. YC4-1]TYS89732.1 DNA starvation/stationary phase protection protein [Rossellomorea aquimaris]
MNQQLVVALNKQLANWNVLYTKLHNYHWYVTGPEFFTLHEKFEEYYNEAGNYIDEVAERILTIKGKPIATLREYLETATIEESNGKESSTEMVDALVNDFEQIVKDSKKIIETAEDSQDQPTADLFIGIKTSLEQHIWMLNAFNKR